MKLIIATTNQNKVNEIVSLLPKQVQVLSLADINFSGDIPEDHDNIEDNSLQKALTIWEFTHKACLSDDSGMFVEALNGEPGVYSAMYAGPQRSNQDNIEKVLKKLGDSSNRKAYFKTVFTLVINEKSHQFTGILEGLITREPRGNNGFGYDPIFELPNGKTLAEIPLEEKKIISHRGKALQKVITFIENLASK